MAGSESRWIDRALVVGVVAYLGLVVLVKLMLRASDLVRR